LSISIKFLFVKFHIFNTFTITYSFQQKFGEQMMCNQDRNLVWIFGKKAPKA